MPLHRPVLQSCTGLVAPPCVSLLPRKLQGTWEHGRKDASVRLEAATSTPSLTLSPMLCSSYFPGIKDHVLPEVNMAPTPFLPLSCQGSIPSSSPQVTCL